MLCPFISKGDTFVNDIVYPQHTYMLKDYDNQIFFQTFLKRWRPYDDFVRFDKIPGLVMHTGKKVVFRNPDNHDTLTVRLINGDEFKELKQIKSVIRLGVPGIGNDSVKVMFLGDSYTQGLYFKKAVIESGFVPNVKLIGTIGVNGAKPHAHEGRGGWSLYRYFSNQPQNEYFYNPFWQPDGDCKYWGSTGFWKNCIYVSKNKVEDFNLKYFCNGYDISNYGNDGKLVKPQKNDLMWDSEAKAYIRWTGKKWKVFTDDDMKWKFDYKKYIDMHDFDKPDFLFVMLGLNDFRSGKLNPDFSRWNGLIEELYKSYKQTAPDGKFVLCIPCSSCGLLDNTNGDFTVRQNAVMWNVRKNVIESFEGRENEDFYLLDVSSTIDNENGYRIKDGIQTGNPHPYLDYGRLGIPVAAFIQYHR